MKRTAGFILSLTALVVLAISASAETVSTGLILSPANENPPIAGLNAQGAFQITVVVTRDTSGAITGGTVRFVGNAVFAGAATVTGLHIHEGAATANGPVVINTGISNASPVTLAAGSGIFDYNVTVTDAALLGRLLKNPTGFYVNLHTSVNAGGAIRGQLVRFEERLVQTVTMTNDKEVPPVTNQPGNAVATITSSPTRDDKGAITGGTVTFSMQYNFDAAANLTGLHIHEGAEGANGPVVINTGVGGATNTIALANGKGSANFTVPVITAAQLGALQRMIANPAGFYVNVHTSVNAGGVARAQLSALSSTPPIIQFSDTYFLPTGNSDAPVKMLATGIDLGTSAVINGTTVIPVPDLTTGYVTVNIPAALRSTAGVLYVQARNGQGLMSTPVQIVVADNANVNTVSGTTVDAAKFGTSSVAPNSIAALFGTKLASTTVASTATPLPFTLDGTSVYVNGVSARLFLVSVGQVNYLVPEGTPAGPAQVVVVAKDGTVTRGVVNVTPSAPGIFTRLANGLGAPAAVAGPDGVNFPTLMSNADGTAVTIDAGNYVMLFGTGFRYASGAMTMSIGGTAVTPIGFSAQSQFAGLDQANVQIPAAMAGKGDVDLTLTVDGKVSNTVKLKIK
ncbi:MAG TPA: CHRD domain-containing protein [Blastocatellia bacterium]|nr:CHRD domain-containing protein [Blastocatellia bacterium]